MTLSGDLEEIEAEADIVVVWGSLGPLLNGLNSQEGANFEAIPFVSVALLGALDDVERDDLADLIEDCGDELNPEVDALSVATSVFGVTGSSGSSF